MIGGALHRSEAAERAVLLRPDVVLLDINLDYELGGIDTAFALRRIAPSTAFVLVSPFDDPERLSIVPRGLGMDWSYILTSTAEDGDELANAIHGAAWSIPYIDRHIDKSRLGGIQARVEKAVEQVMRRTRERSRPSNIYYADWHGTVQKFQIPDDPTQNGD
jgi:DNA-binding NarL/FixJ family response regulator